MKVRIIRGIQIPSFGIYGVGQDVEVPDVLGVQLIAQGVAQDTSNVTDEPRVVSLKVQDGIDLLDPRDPPTTPKKVTKKKKEK